MNTHLSVSTTEHPVLKCDMCRCDGDRDQDPSSSLAAQEGRDAVDLGFWQVEHPPIYSGPN